jgi:hypothetical protein
MSRDPVGVYDNSGLTAIEFSRDLLVRLRTEAARRNTSVPS